MEINSLSELSKLTRSKVSKKKSKHAVRYVEPEVVIGKYFVSPMKMECATNKREHWSVIAKRKQNQRGIGYLFTRLTFPNITYPLNVYITRIGNKLMDNDNLATSAKYLRDGIADALGIDDGSEKVRWIYKQEIQKMYGVKVEITSGE